MNFRTEIKPWKSVFLLDPGKPITLLGSCFADNIGEKMQNSGWPAYVNPCGVVYNPASIALLLQLALTHRVHRRAIVENSITQRDGKYVSWLMDSKCASLTPHDVADKACEAIDRLENCIETSHCLAITFGTPDVWLLNGTDRLVGNCHKHPSSEFERHRLSSEEIVGTWIALISAIRERNPELKLIFTVSPRRYLGEGFADNSRLKAILLLACEKLCSSIADSEYFPAYEILNDDLRDYRFYASDMLHPSPVAIEYIYQLFKEHYLSLDDQKVLKESEKKARRNAHRPIL